MVEGEKDRGYWGEGEAERDRGGWRKNILGSYAGRTGYPLFFCGEINALKFSSMFIETPCRHRI